MTRKILATFLLSNIRTCSAGRFGLVLVSDRRMLILFDADYSLEDIIRRVINETSFR